MNMPGYTGEASLYRSRGHYGVTEAISDRGTSVHPELNFPQIIPIDICLRFPQLCQLGPAVKVSWLTCNNGSGYVVVTGSNFAPNSGVQVDIGNCQGPFPVNAGATADGNGSFTTWAPCDCSGSTTVTALDSAGHSAQGSAAMPC
jgi:hypothetical protein